MSFRQLKQCQQNKYYFDQIMKQFSESYSPLLLIKLVKHFFKIKLTAKSSMFFSKLKFDQSVVSKQNLILKQINLINIDQKKNIFRNSLNTNQSVLIYKSDQAIKVKNLQRNQQNGRNITSQMEKDNYYLNRSCIEILIKRLDYFSQFIDILKNNNQQIKSADNIKQEIAYKIQFLQIKVSQFQTKYRCEDNLNKDKQNDNKYYRLNLGKKRKLYTPNYNNQSHRLSLANKTIDSSTHRIKTQQQTKKDDFLNLNRKSEILKQPTIPPKLAQPVVFYKQKANKIRKSNFKLIKTFQTYDKQSKNTQQRFFEDLQMQAQLQKKNRNRKQHIRQSFRSMRSFAEQIFIPTVDSQQQNKSIITLKCIVNEPLDISYYKYRKNVSQIVSKKVKQDKNLAKYSFFNKINQSIMDNSDSSHQNSIVYKQQNKQSQTKPTIQNEDEDQISTNFKPNKGLYGIKTKFTNTFQGQNILKFRKGRIGPLQKTQPIQFDDNQSIHSSVYRKKVFIDKTKIRRKGKNINQNLGKYFQRILQDDKMQNLVISNEIRLSKLNANSLNVLKQRQTKNSSKLKGATERSTDNTAMQNTFSKSIFLLRPKFVNCKKQSNINYSDLLALQKNLKPLAHFQQQKSINKYTFLNGNNVDDYQFKFRDGFLQFNHQFILRNQQYTNQQQDQRNQIRKSIRKQNSKIEFMKRFKKYCQNWRQPVQIGLDKDQFVSTVNSKCDILNLQDEDAILSYKQAYI